MDTASRRGAGSQGRKKTRAASGRSRTAFHTATNEHDACGRVSAVRADSQFLAAGMDHHAWVCEPWKRLHPPLLTCEPVPTEAAFLLKREGRGADPIFELLERGLLRVGLEAEDQLADLRVDAPLPGSPHVDGRRLPGAAG